jgi:hypothetical protein
MWIHTHIQAGILHDTARGSKFPLNKPTEDTVSLGNVELSVFPMSYMQDKLTRLRQNVRQLPVGRMPF